VRYVQDSSEQLFAKLCWLNIIFFHPFKRAHAIQLFWSAREPFGVSISGKYRSSIKIFVWCDLKLVEFKNIFEILYGKK
jgi:hypothetical protein